MTPPDPSTVRSFPPAGSAAAVRSRKTGPATECGAGAAGALAGLASLLTLGLLSYAALGPQAAMAGIPAAFVATVVGGSLFAWLARGPMPAGGPSSAPSLILAALVAGVVADPAFDVGRGTDLADLLALTAASVVGTGVLQIAFAMSGFTRAAKFVPQPVLAGFMNGVAVIFVLSQVPTLFGWSPGQWTVQGWRALTSIEPVMPVIGLITVIAITTWPALAQRPWMPRVASALPATFAGLLTGCAAYGLLASVAPGLSMGGLVGDIPRAWPSIDRLAPLFGGDDTGLLRRHAVAASTTALLMAMIGTLDIVLNGLALDQALQTRTEPRRELLALGAANIAAGAFGGLPLQLVRSRALATWHAGGRRPASLWFGNALFAMLALVGGPLLALLPKVVLAGIMVMVGLLLFDAWSLRLALRWIQGRRSAEARLNLALVLIVCVASVGFGFAIGVAIGGVLALVIFVRSMDHSLIRVRRTAAEQPSHRIYATSHEAALRTLRPSIAILELEGALFFGSADRLTREVDALLTGRRTVVMDLRRITVIDASGAVVLSQIHRRLEDEGMALLLAGVVAGERHAEALTEFAGAALPATAWYPDVDRAVEAAEVHALAATGGRPVEQPVPLAQSGLMLGLDAGACAVVASFLQPRRLAAGERLFAQGDAGDRLYVLTSGSISVLGADLVGVFAHGAGGRRRRFVTCSPGMMLGEIAMLDGGGRSAEAVADVDSEVYAMTAASLLALGVLDPLLCARVYRNIALHLAARLRQASLVLSASAV